MLLLAYRWLTLPVRLGLLIVWVIGGCCVQLASFAWLQPKTKHAAVQNWSKGLLRIMGVSVITHGYTHHRLQAASRYPTALVVSNHISWLDILLILSTLPVVFVAKSDIRSWPVIGLMVAMAGTCFIVRERKQALRGVHGTLTQHLAAGQSVCVFPEGTTSDGHGVLPFHAGLFESAIAAKVPVLPLRLGYSSPAAAYIGDMSLLSSVRNILLAPSLTATVRVLSTIELEAHTRQTLCEKACNLITKAVP